VILALIGSLLTSVVAMSLRIINNSGKVHFIVISMGFVIGHLLICPLLLFTKLFISPVDPTSIIITDLGEVGSSLHSYTFGDCAIIISIAFFVFIGQIF
jgi:hypothetical protein